jgi:PGF-CTERM protein
LNVPHFSDQTVTVESTPPPASGGSGGIPGFEPLAALAAGFAAAFVLRRKR